MPDHTPGPWALDEEDGSIHGPTSQWVCDLNWNEKNPEHVANIRVILAAPDLLSACRLYLAAVTFEEERDALDAIRNVVKKATDKSI